MPPSGSGGLPKATGRYHATDASLDFALDLARRAGVHADRAETRAASATLYEDAFAALLAALDIPAADVPFHPPFHPEVFGLTSALAADPGGDGPRVLFDETLDLWLFAMAHFTTVAAFGEIDDDAFFAILKKIKGALRLFDSAGLRPRVLDDLRPELEGHPDCLNLSGGVARALMVFVLCHEIAHCRLGHLRQAVAPALELEADEAAARMFVDVIGKEPALKASPVYVDPKLAGVPVFLPLWLGLQEQYRTILTGRAPNRSTHPAPQERAEATRRVLAPHLNETAAQILTALENAVDDCARAMAAGY